MTFDDTPHSGDLFFSDDKRLLDHTWLKSHLLSQPWTDWYDHEILENAILGSMCFGVYLNEPGKFQRQVAFARVVTDGATNHYLCDFVVGVPFRYQGVGKFMMRNILSHRSFKNGVFNLRTNTAQGFYAKFGFEKVEAMRRIPPQDR